MVAKKEFSGQIKEKLPMYADVEFEGKTYKYRIWKEYSPSQGKECVCASGPSEPPHQMIQIGRMFGCNSLKEALHLIECGFKNQKKDRETGQQPTAS